jgi:hypothetical protein
MVEHVASLSDHCGVVFEIVLQNVANPSVKKTFHETYWKLNVSILKDEDFLHNFVVFGLGSSLSRVVLVTLRIGGIWK